VKALRWATLALCGAVAGAAESGPTLREFLRQQDVREARGLPASLLDAPNLEPSRCGFSERVRVRCGPTHRIEELRCVESAVE
jgi:hypothetical protein